MGDAAEDAFDSGLPDVSDGTYDKRCMEKDGEENWQRLVRLLRDPRCGGRYDLMADAAKMIEFLVGRVESLPSASAAIQKLREFQSVVYALKDTHWYERGAVGGIKHPTISPAIAAFSEEVEAMLRALASGSQSGAIDGRSRE